MNQTINPTIENPHHPALTPALRWMSNLMCLWGLCARPTCRRAKTCRGAPQDCLTRYAPLVPEDAREGVKAMIEGQSLRLDFDALYEQTEQEIKAVAEWAARVQQSCGRS